MLNSYILFCWLNTYLIFYSFCCKIFFIEYMKYTNQYTVAIYRT